MIVLDEDDCMVDIAKYFMKFSEDESCGKCTPCREGTKRMSGDPGADHRRQRRPQGPGKAQAAGPPDPQVVALRAGPRGPEPGPQHARTFPATSTSPTWSSTVVPPRRCTALIRYEISPRSCVGCTALCPQLSRGMHQRHPPRAALDRPASLHQVRALLRGLPLRRRQPSLRSRRSHGKAENQLDRRRRGDFRPTRARRSWRRPSSSASASPGSAIIPT